MNIDYLQLLACVALVGLAVGYFGGWALEAIGAWLRRRKARKSESGERMYEGSLPDRDEWIECTLLSDNQRREFNPYLNQWRSTPLPAIDSSLLPLPKED
jgi:hypothetical protein